MGGRDKMFMDVGGLSVLARTVSAMAGSPLIDEIVVVTRPESLERAAGVCEKYAAGKPSKAVAGGDTRLRSVYNGVFEASRGSGLIAIHDGARPFVTRSVVKRAILEARRFGAAAPALPVAFTVKSAEGGTVISTLDRRKLYEIQTPQVFRAELIKAALTNAILKGLEVTDDCMAVESVGYSVRLVEGSRDNIKITTPEDVALAGAIAAGGREPSVRVGYGYDVHRLVKGRECVLCGVRVPFEMGPDGHSDADAPVHALIDAILGAAALGDIGGHFPDDDAKWLGADSLLMLEEVWRDTRGRGYVFGNADITVVMQRPKLAPYIADMRGNLARALGVEPGRISVKATTEEGLGATGTGLGVAAHAAVLLRAPYREAESDANSEDSDDIAVGARPFGEKTTVDKRRRRKGK
jgi:2-C-methyl-D-erythritol 2,4-cyclodiphosphate synthase/2-C-methyl-D-erythritol 4-phosphate cytidylyltransferase